MTNKNTQEDTSQRRRLKKIDDGWMGGVSAGIAYYLKIDTWMIRLVFCLLILFTAYGLAIYIILWLILPEYENVPDDYYDISG